MAGGPSRRLISALVALPRPLWQWEARTTAIMLPVIIEIKLQTALTWSVEVGTSSKQNKRTPD